MASRTVTINIKTTAQLAQLDKLIAKLDGVKQSMSDLTTASAGIATVRKEIDELGTALSKLGAASKGGNASLRATARALTDLANGTASTTRGVRNTTAALTTVNAAVAKSRTPLSLMSSAYKQVERTVQSVMMVFNKLMAVLRVLATILSNTVGRVLKGASAAFSVFGKTAAATFSGLQRAINATNNGLKGFASAVSTHMKNAERSVKNFYNAGWSLLTSGYVTNQAGKGVLGGMFGSLDKFMGYEQALTRTAISAAELKIDPKTGNASYQANPKLIEQLIFDLQKGTFGEPVKAFDAKDLAEGLYFYTSAIGRAVTEENMAEVGSVVSTIMQMAAVTRTGLETATKGVMNVALEFGIDPRSDKNAGAIQNIAAQMGYLANISTMEVPDIVETFKMVGPMAHILSNKNVAGAGLNETMALTFFASELGLRGGNVGRGLNQALTTLLDPSDKALAAAAKAFGIGASEEAFRSFFFNAEGQLQGGLEGLFSKLGSIKDSDVAPFLAELFTTNATRSVIAITEAIRKSEGGLQGMMERISGRNPMQWLSSAVLATNDTIFGNFQYMKNAWFAVQTEIIRSVEGPLKSAFEGFGQVLWRIGDILHKNAWIGQLIAGIATIVGVLLSAIGAFFIFGGSVLLVLKAFTMLGGLLAPTLFFFLSMITALAVLVPLFVGIGAAVVVVRRLWESNFRGIQDRFDSFAESVTKWADWLAKNGPFIAESFGNIFSAQVLEKQSEFVKWLDENTAAIARAKTILYAFAGGFVQGLVGALAVTLKTLVTVFDTLFNRIDSGARTFAAFFEDLTGVKLSVEGLAQVIGVVLGGALAALILRHFTPAIAVTLAFRTAIFALTAAFTVLSTAISVVSAIIGVLQAVVGGMVALGAIGTIVAAALLGLGAVFIYLAATSASFRDDLWTIAQAIWDGLAPAFRIIGAIVVVAFQYIRDAILETTAYFAEHREEVTRMATALGLVLVVAVAAAVVSIVALVAALSLLSQAFVDLFSDDAAMSGFLDSVRNDMNEFLDLASMGNVDMARFKLVVQMRFAAMSTILASEFAAMYVKAMGTAFKGIVDVFSGTVGGMIPGGNLMADKAFEIAFGGTPQQMSDAFNLAADLLETQMKGSAENIDNLADMVVTVPLPKVLPEDMGDTYPGDHGETDILSKITRDNLNLNTIVDTIMSGFKSGGSLEGVMDEVFTSLGFDVSTIENSEYMKFLDGITKATSDASDDLLVDFTRQKSLYESFVSLTDKYGEAYAREIFNMKGIPIPSEVGTYDEYLQSLDEAGAATVEKIAELNKEVTDAVRQADLGTVMKGLFGSGSVGSGLFMFGDKIIENAGSPSWLNMTELLADAAGTGLLGANMSGNIHKALKEPLAIISEQTGVSISTLLKDIPKYYAPEEFVPTATGELLKMLNTMPKEMYKTLDTLGAGVYTDLGLDWSELVQYGISQGISKQDWNLVDYISDSWGMSVEDAEQYLINNGIDPNTISQRWFDDTQMLINSQGGQISVLTGEWYDYLIEATQDGTDKTLEITQAAFDALPDAVKIGYTQLGYTFVIGAESAGNEAINSFNALNTRLSSYSGWGDWVAEAVKGPTDGLKNVIDLGNGFILIQDALGNSVTIPAPEYQAYVNALREAEEATHSFNYARDGLGVQQTSEEYITSAGGYGPAPSATPTVDASILGLPDLEASKALGTDLGTQIIAGVNAAFAADPAVFDPAFQSFATSAATAFSTQLSTEMSKVMIALDPTSSGEGSGGAAKGPSSGPYDSMFKMYATLASEAFKTQLDTDMATVLGGLGQPKTASDGEGTTFAVISSTGPYDAMFSGYATAAVSAFELGLAPMQGVIRDMGATVSAEILNISSWGYNAAYYAGFQIGQGLAAGIDASASLVELAAGRLIAAAESAANVKAKIASPSKLFAEVGVNMGLGIAEGMSSTISSNVGTMDSLVSSVREVNRNDKPSGESSSTSPLIIQIENVTIEKDVDLMKLAADLNRLTGHKVELARRGMVPIDETKST